MKTRISGALLFGETAERVIDYQFDDAFDLRRTIPEFHVIQGALSILLKCLGNQCVNVRLRCVPNATKVENDRVAGRDSRQHRCESNGTCCVLVLRKTSRARLNDYLSAHLN